MKHIKAMNDCVMNYGLMHLTCCDNTCKNEIEGRCDSSRRRGGSMMCVFLRMNIIFLWEYIEIKY
jgi:hypothetical protein